MRTIEQLKKYLQLYLPFKGNFKDHSQNSNDGTPTDIIHRPTSRGLKPSFNGSTSKIVIGNVYNGIKTVSFYVKLASITEDLIDLNAIATVDINAGIVRGNNFASPTIYVDGQATASLSDLTGFHHIVITTATGIDASAVDIGEIAASFGKIFIEDIRFYSDVLTVAEVLNIYNSTKHAHGMIPAERSYTHQLGIKPEDGLVLGFDGHTKNADRTFTDMSGESNHGTNVGTSRDVGYFGEIRSFDRVNDYIDCGNDASLTFIGQYSMEFWAYRTVNTNYEFILGHSTENGKFGFNIGVDKLFVRAYNGGGTDLTTSISTATWNHVVIVRDANNKVDAYINGGAANRLFGDVVQSGTLKIGLIGTDDLGNNFNGTINDVRIYNQILSVNEIKSKFNQLATLPLFHVNFTDYPDNEDVSYTDNEPIPYSTMKVGSNGTFKIDDDQLVCSENTSTLTLRNNHEFDGNEYITIDIGGTKYNGTGTITQGTVTISIAQGSKFITVAMSDTDVLNSIDIQFRAEVS